MVVAIVDGGGGGARRQKSRGPFNDRGAPWPPGGPKQPLSSLMPWAGPACSLGTQSTLGVPLNRCCPCVHHQVVLLLAYDDHMSKTLSDTLAERTGCEVRQVGPEPLDDVMKWKEERGLDWKVVAFMGKKKCPYLLHFSMSSIIAHEF